MNAWYVVMTFTGSNIMHVFTHTSSHGSDFTQAHAFNERHAKCIADASCWNTKSFKVRAIKQDEFDKLAVEQMLKEIAHES